MDGQRDSLALNNRQKTRLLSLGLEADRPAIVLDGNELRGDLLCDILRCPLPADRPEHGVLSSHGGMPAPSLRIVAGPPLRELLLDPKTDVSVLQRIKKYAKTLGTRAGSEGEEDVFLAVYFAAIAAARVFHDERITEHSDEDLTRFLDSFSRAPWVQTHLAELFRHAIYASRGPAHND